MDYQKIYNSLIQKSIEQYGHPAGYKKSGKLHTHIEIEKFQQFKNNISGDIQIHHIIPKCISNDNSPDNLVYLTVKQHKLAHRLLFKIHEYDEYRNKMYAAYLLMYNICKRYNYKTISKYINVRPVVALDIKTKQLVKSFDSIYEAELFVKRKCICEALSKRVKTVGGYIWLYREEYEDKIKFQNFLDSYKDPLPNGFVNKIPIYHILLDNNVTIILNEYDSLEAAAKDLSISVPLICNVCKCKAAHANNELFIYKEDYIDLTKRNKFINSIKKLKVKKLKMNAKPIIAFDKKYNNIIGYFYSNRHAGEFLHIKSYSNIPYVCNGKLKTVGGYGFVYEKDLDNFLSMQDINMKQHLYQQYIDYKNKMVNI